MSRLTRLLDLSVASVGLAATWPVMLVAAVAVGVESGAPVLFRQRRVGRAFREFDLLKFRSMVTDVHARGRSITVGRDPRITRVGHLLRATKVDELPQLWNVLRGDMSIVGPRPEVPKYVDRFRDDYAELLRARPGITDPASIEFRHESELLATFEDPDRAYVDEVLPRKIALSREYLRTRTVFTDLGVIARTALAVLRPSS